MATYVKKGETKWKRDRAVLCLWKKSKKSGKKSLTRSEFFKKECIEHWIHKLREASKLLQINFSIHLWGKRTPPKACPLIRWQQWLFLPSQRWLGLDLNTVEPKGYLIINLVDSERCARPLERLDWNLCYGTTKNTHTQNSPQSRQTKLGLLSEMLRCGAGEMHKMTKTFQKFILPTPGLMLPGLVTMGDFRIMTLNICNSN